MKDLAELDNPVKEESGFHLRSASVILGTPRRRYRPCSSSFARSSAHRNALTLQALLSMLCVLRRPSQMTLYHTKQPRPCPEFDNEKDQCHLTRARAEVDRRYLISVDRIGRRRERRRKVTVTRCRYARKGWRAHVFATDSKSMWGLPSSQLSLDDQERKSEQKEARQMQSDDEIRSFMHSSPQ